MHYRLVGRVFLLPIFLCLHAVEELDTGGIEAEITHNHNYATATLAGFFSGAVGGVAFMTAFSPWRYFQNRDIQGLPIEWKKPQYWFRGLPSVASGKAGVIGVQMGGYQALSRFVQQLHPEQQLSYAEEVAVITSAGLLSAPIANATQLVSLHQQNTGASFFEVIKSFPGGYGALWRGISPVIIREALSANVYMHMFPRIKTIAEDYTDSGSLQLASSAITSGVLTALVTQPLQVIVTSMHADIEKKEAKTSWETAQRLYKKLGIKAFSKGIGYRCGGLVCALPLPGLIQEKLSSVLKEQ